MQIECWLTLVRALLNFRGPNWSAPSLWSLPGCRRATILASTTATRPHRWFVALCTMRWYGYLSYHWAGNKFQLITILGPCSWAKTSPVHFRLLTGLRITSEPSSRKLKRNTSEPKWVVVLSYMVLCCHRRCHSRWIKWRSCFVVRNFIFVPSYRLFRCMHKTLNINKK